MQKLLLIKTTDSAVVVHYVIKGIMNITATKGGRSQRCTGSSEI